MAINHKLSWTIFFLCVVFITQSHQSSSGCSFQPVNNQSLVYEVYHYFDEDSDVKIVEYVISLNVTPSFNWSKHSHHERFQPWRWFRTQSSHNSRLLLAFHYYYGLFKDYLSLKTRTFEVTLTPIPEGCVNNIGEGEIDQLLREYLLRDFDINPQAVRHPYTPSDDVSVCSTYLHDVDGWGRLTYRCCKYDDDENTDQKKECEDMYNDGWVWALRTFIIIFTILLFLHLPHLIPRGHHAKTYMHFPNEEMTFNIVVTSRPDRFSNLKNSTTLKFHEWRKMSAFRMEVAQLEPEVTYTAHIKRIDCHVKKDRIAHRHESPISLSKSFFNDFIFCKVRHNTPVEECCHTSICGQLPNDKTHCPPWHSWLRALRVIILMSIVAVPSLPLFYVLTTDNLDHQQLDKAHTDRGLAKAFNNHPGKDLSRIFVGITSFMYVLNMVILVFDGATDGHLTKMYSNLRKVSKRNSSLKQKMNTAKSVVRKLFIPLQRYGIYVLPFWLIVVCCLPAALVTLCITNSPMARILIHAVNKLLERMNFRKRTDLHTEEKFVSFCKVFWFLISLIFVFMVITMGVNFIVHVGAIFIVEIVADASVAYQVLPLVFFLLFYIRDYFHRVGEKYRKYLDIVLRSLLAREEEAVHKEIRNLQPIKQNKMFQMSRKEFEQDQGSCRDVVTACSTDSEADIVALSDVSEPEARTSLFEVYRGALWIRLQRSVLLLSKDTVVGTTKKFLFQACDIDCHGIPGQLEENLIMACLDFLKIAVFLLFVFIAVMAYGSIYSISPTNHLFITLVTGVAPLVIRNVFKDQSRDEMVDGTSLRFENQLDQKIQSFTQSWELRDLIIDAVQRRPEENDVTSDQPSTSGMSDYEEPANEPIQSMLILELNEETIVPMDQGQRHPRNVNRHTPKQRSKLPVGNCFNLCSGKDHGKRLVRSNAIRYKDVTYHAGHELASGSGMSCNQNKNDFSPSRRGKRKSNSKLETIAEDDSTLATGMNESGQHVPVISIEENLEDDSFE